jgi:glycosyltransferase 2 family protein
VTAVEQQAIVVVDTKPSRIRRSVDAVRLVGLIVLLALLGAIGSVASNTSQGASNDLGQALGDLPTLLKNLIQVVGTIGVLAVPFGYVVTLIVRGQYRRLIEALLTGVLAILIVWGLNAALDAASSSDLYQAMTLVRDGTRSLPFDAYLTALVAFVTVTGVIGISAEQPWRQLFIVAIGLYVVASFIVGQSTLLSLLSSLVIGSIVGVAVRYVGGSVNLRPDGQRIADSLRSRAIFVTRLERNEQDDEDFRFYDATTRSGSQLVVHVFDRDQLAVGAFVRVYHLVRLQREVTRGPEISLESAAERRSLLALAAEDAGVRVPHLVAGVPCGPDAIVLAYDRVEGTPLSKLSADDLTDEHLRQLWREVGKLHEHRVTHRGLSADAIIVDRTGRVVLPIPDEGNAFATDLRISLDRAQVLVSTAAIVGPERAVAAARAVLSDEQAGSIRAVLQPVALPHDTRVDLKHHKGMLVQLREQLLEQTHQAPPDLVRLERVRPRTVVTIVALIIAGYLLTGQLGSVDLVTVFSEAHWGWVPFVLLFSALTYIAAAITLIGYVREKLSFVRTTIAQVAASFAGFVTPPAVGGLAINVRYLQKAGLSTAAAATSVGACQAVNAVSHFVLLIVVAALTGAKSQHDIGVPGWLFIALGVIAVVVLILLAIPITRRWMLARVLPPLREAIPRLLDLVTSPRKLTEGVLGILLMNAAYVGALWCATRAFGGTVDLVGIALVYLVGGAIGSVAPTPGGLGAMELALSTGLTAAGMPTASAVSAVLLFRVATFWLPVPVGWLSIRWLQRRDAL